MTHPLLDDLEGARAEIDTVRYDLQCELDAGYEWLRPFVRRLTQFNDDLQVAADKHLGDGQ